MNDEHLISELTEMKAALSTLLDFQRIWLESLTGKDLIPAYTNMVAHYFDENPLRIKVGLPPVEYADRSEKPDLSGIFEIETEQ